MEIAIMPSVFISRRESILSKGLILAVALYFVVLIDHVEYALLEFISLETQGIFITIKVCEIGRAHV